MPRLLHATQQARTRPPARRVGIPTPAKSSPGWPGVTAREDIVRRMPACPCGGGCPRCKGDLPIQAKLTIGAPGDRYEQEADRVADQVMRMPEPGRDDEAGEIQNPLARDEQLRRQPVEKEEEEEEEELQRELAQPKALPGGAPKVTPDVASRIQALRGGGQGQQPVPTHLAAGIGALRGGGAPLSDSARAFFEPRFGRDFSGVRVHTGPRAEGLSKALNARAFTVGSDIAFARSQYAPETTSGRRLLAHELGHVVQQAPAGLLLRDSERDVEDPQAKLAPPAMARWQKLYEEIWALRSDLWVAETASPSVTRKGWLNQLASLSAQLGAVDNETALAAVERSYRTWESGIYDAATAAGESWVAVNDRYHAEVGRLLDETSLAGIHAFHYLTGIYKETKARIDRGGLDLLVRDDFIRLQGMLDDDTHLWFGELQAARQRTAELKKMLDVVGSLRGAGMDEDKLVPGWHVRIFEETGRLATLTENAPKQTSRVEFEKLRKDLEMSRGRTLARHPRKKGLAVKGFFFVKGALSAVIDPVVEAGKQAVDLAQISMHFQTFGLYEPSFISDVGKEAEQGATTADLLKGMAKGLLETPERLWTAIQNDDWEAIGKETTNLYMLAKTGKQGAAKAAPWIALVRARATVFARGGMSTAAALAVLKIARETKLVIRFRKAGRAAISLRAKGHPPKPEFLKMKSINKDDLHLGASKADLGKVGYFEPKLPDNLKGLSDKLQTDIKTRYADRLKEWNSPKYKREVARLENTGLIERQGQTLVDPKSGKAFTSDYDLFDIRRGKTTGEGIEYESLPADVRMRLEAKPIEVQHGAHLDSWEIPAGKAGGFAKIITDVRPRTGVEPLIEFHPDGKIRYTYFVD